ncbi:MAG: hypothetical protein Q9168_000647 [Polycauliona sp. 1 TL-2023]
MVYYFVSSLLDPPAVIYVGKDKFESTANLKPHQFHADNLSSAHVYLRLQPGQEWDSLPAALIEDCAQLTKANSIEGDNNLSSRGTMPLISKLLCTSNASSTDGLFLSGNKKDNVTIIYTPWSNLLKNASMATGQVSFKDHKKTRATLVPTRLNPTINRLMKTRTVSPVDELFANKEQHLSELRAKAREKAKEARKEEERVTKERREEKYRREHAYEDLMNGDQEGDGSGKRSNQDAWDDDDFM